MTRGSAGLAQPRAVPVIDALGKNRSCPPAQPVNGIESHAVGSGSPISGEHDDRRRPRRIRSLKPVLGLALAVNVRHAQFPETRGQSFGPCLGQNQHGPVPAPFRLAELPDQRREILFGARPRRIDQEHVIFQIPPPLALGHPLPPRRAVIEIVPGALCQHEDPARIDQCDSGEAPGRAGSGQIAVTDRGDRRRGQPCRIAGRQSFEKHHRNRVQAKYSRDVERQQRDGASRIHFSGHRQSAAAAPIHQHRRAALCRSSVLDSRRPGKKNSRNLRQAAGGSEREPSTGGLHERKDGRDMDPRFTRQFPPKPVLGIAPPEARREAGYPELSVLSFWRSERRLRRSKRAIQRS